LTQGTSYKFRVQARNSFGYSLESDTVEILAAEVPATPLAPTTIFNREYITIDWTAPDDHGATITSYEISIKASDNSFQLHLMHCDGTDATIISQTYCDIPVEYFTLAPFNLPWGSDIYAKVIATNSYGDSLQSLERNGANMITYPDTPINFQEDLSLKTASEIGLEWQDGAHNGGRAITNYIISQMDGQGIYQVVDNTITTTSYVVTGLTYGQTYKFLV
jgi:hypothetical protein